MIYLQQLHWCSTNKGVADRLVILLYHANACARLQSTGLLLISGPVQRTLTIVGVSITVWLTSYLTGLDLTKQVKLLLIQHKQSRWGAWIAEWYNTWLRILECCALGREFKPQWGQNYFGSSNPSTLKNFQGEIKTGNTKINTIICYLNVKCLWKLENYKNGIKHFFLKKLKQSRWIQTK